MGVEFGVWLAGLFVCLLLLFLVTEIFKALTSYTYYILLCFSMHSI